MNAGGPTIFDDGEVKKETKFNAGDIVKYIGNDDKIESSDLFTVGEVIDGNHYIIYDLNTRIKNGKSIRYAKYVEEDELESYSFNTGYTFNTSKPVDNSSSCPRVPQVPYRLDDFPNPFIQPHVSYLNSGDYEYNFLPPNCACVLRNYKDIDTNKYKLIVFICPENAPDDLVKVKFIPKHNGGEPMVKDIRMSDVVPVDKLYRTYTLCQLHGFYRSLTMDLIDQIDEFYTDTAGIEVDDYVVPDYTWLTMFEDENRHPVGKVLGFDYDENGQLVCVVGVCSKEDHNDTNHYHILPGNILTVDEIYDSTVSDLYDAYDKYVPDIINDLSYHVPK